MNKIVSKLRDLSPLTYAGLTRRESMSALEQQMGHHNRSREGYVREPDTLEHRIAS
jgi:hypothetical protein